LKDRVPAPATIRLVLAGTEAPALFRLEQLFGLEKDFEVIASCGKGEDVLFAVSALYPDILVLTLPPAAAADGLDLVRRMKAGELPTRVVFLCASLKEGELQEAVGLGVQAVVPKSIAPAVLVHCIRDIHGGGLWLGSRPASPVPTTTQATNAELRNNPPPLTRREAEVVRLVCVGLPNKQIAARLAVAEGTVKTHLHRIYEKLEVRGRLELSLYGRADRL
jgi:two-component system nitrate/nitrite response regulator NarL